LGIKAIVINLHVFLSICIAMEFVSLTMVSISFQGKIQLPAYIIKNEDKVLI